MADDALRRHTTGANVHLMGQIRGALQYIRLESNVLQERLTVMEHLAPIIGELGRWIRSAIEARENPAKREEFLQATASIKQGFDSVALEIAQGHGKPVPVPPPG